LTDPLIVARAIHFASAIMIVGIGVFEALVAGPALECAGPAAVIATSFRARMAGLAWAGLAVALLSGGVWLVLLAAKIADKSVYEVTTDGTAWIVLTETRFGIDWQLRFLTAGLLAGCLLVSKRGKGDFVPYRLPFAILTAVFAGMLAWSGHGGASSGVPGYVHVAADFVHLIAAGAWVGGLVPLVWLLGTMRRSGRKGWAHVASDITWRFSNLGILAVGAILLTGIVNVRFLAGGAQGLTATHYGHLLLFKIALFVAMVCFAAINRLYLAPELSIRVDDPELGTRAVRSLQRNAALEILLGLIILAIVAILGITPPGIETHDHVH
jgi:putative copper resistance protein D